MNIFDWGVIALYIVGIIATGAILGRTQTAINDYFLGGQKVSWWESGLSTMSSQLGAISFISAPAFVALKDGGGLKWILSALMSNLDSALNSMSAVTVRDFLSEVLETQCEP